MRPELKAFLALALLAAPISAQDVNLIGPKAPQVDAVFKRFTSSTPGCALGISQDGKVVYARGYGMANLEYGVPMSPATVSESGSVAKQFTAAAIVLLVQDGKVSLDDEVKKYIPELTYTQPITIRHMLNHTSGLRDMFGLLAYAGRPSGRTVYGVNDIYEIARRQKTLNFTPGDDYLYSNTTYTLMNVLVERVTGKTFAQFTKERIFEPLGMNHTQWRDDHTRVVKNRAHAYSPAAGGYRNNMPFQNIHGSGGMLTTVGDWLKWNAHLDNPNPKVGGRALVDLLQTRARLNSGEEIEYALGLQVGEYRGVREIGHSGGSAGYSTYLTRFPDQRLAIAVLCNSTDTGPVVAAHQIADVLIPGLKPLPTPAPAITVAASELESRAGLYRDSRTDELLTLRVDNGKLMAAPGGALTAVGAARFRNANGQVEYEFTGEGLQLRRASGRPIAYTRMPLARLTVEQLRGYTGTYHSDELQNGYIVAVQDGKLQLRTSWGESSGLQATYTDGFTIAGDDDYTLLGGGQIRFTRNSSGQVDGFQVFAGRIRHLRFDRRGS